MDPRPPRPAKTESRAKEKTGKRGKAADRFGCLNQFVDLTLREIDPTAATVWLVLFRDTKPDGTARTSQADIARRIGRTTRTVYHGLRKLEKLGLLVMVRRGRINAGASIYRIRPTGKKDGF
jgi:DNA-binding MarR family transcriptional regulator